MTARPLHIPAMLLAVMLVFAAATPATAQEAAVLAGESDAELAAKFLRLSTSTEFSDERPDETKRLIRKWERPIRMLVLGNAEPRHQRLLAEHVDDLRGLTGLPIEITNAGAQHMPVAALGGDVDMIMASDLTRPYPLTLIWNRPGEGLAWKGNFVAAFGDRAQLLRLGEDLNLRSESMARVRADSTTCYGSMFYDIETLEIVFAAAFIRNDLEDWKVQKCLIEEITQGFGLPGDAHGASWTLFNDTVRWRQSALTPYDRLFVQVLYDPRMRRGMDKQEAGRMASELFAEYRNPPATR